MSNLNEIRKAINILVKSGTKKNNITVNESHPYRAGNAAEMIIKIVST